MALSRMVVSRMPVNHGSAAASRRLDEATILSASVYQLQCGSELGIMEAI
jgi:hypothetical protein